LSSKRAIINPQVKYAKKVAKALNLDKIYYEAETPDKAYCIEVE